MQSQDSDIEQHKILIMDDEDYICSILFKMFEKFGYLVELTSNGEQALERYKSLKAEQSPADLTILDLTIPEGMGGRETALKILEFDPEAKILISTGNPNDPQLFDYEECGIKGILSKPFRLNVLMDTVKQIISAP